MSTMTQTVFFEGKKSVTVVCQHCGRFKSFEAERLRSHGGKTVPVKCACGVRFQVFLERRDTYRKPVAIRGCYWCVEPGSIKRWMTLENISLNGLRMEMGPEGMEKITLGDKLKIEFPLGGVEIRCSVVVRNILGTRIGAEFVNMEYKAREVIGFTLMV